MPLASPTARPLAVPPPVARPRPATAAPATARLEGTDILFYGYVLLLAIEYLGLGSMFPVLKVIRLSTFLGYALFAAMIVKVGIGGLTAFRQTRLMMLFAGFTAATVLWAVVQAYVLTAFRAHVDYFALCVATIYLIDRPSRIDRLAFAFVAISTILVVRNLDRLGSELRVGTFRAGYFLGDGNDFAWGLNVLLPFAMHLIFGQRRILTRLFGLGGFLAGVVGIIGTQSRGATLALAAAMLYGWIMLAKRRAVGVAMFALLVVGVLAFAPSHYLNRIQSMTEYQEDSSAQGRLRAWTAAMQMAVDFPLGVGAHSFNSAFGRYYMPQDPEGWAAYRWISAHSVYFKVLGEYGILGLVLLVSIIVLNMRENGALRRQIQAAPERYPIPPHWPVVLNVGMIGYAVSAMFLGGVTYPHLFILTGLTLSCRRLVDAAAAADQQPEAAPPRPEPALAAGLRPVTPAAAGPAPRVGALRPSSSASPRRGRFF